MVDSDPHKFIDICRKNAKECGFDDISIEVVPHSQDTKIVRWITPANPGGENVIWSGKTLL